MYEPIFELKSFGELPLDDRKHLIEVYCEALIATNRTWLKRNPGAPKFYELAPKYALKLRPFGIDRWQDYPQTIALGEGDCKDFVCMRVAELREAGCPDCGPRILAQEAKGIISYHVQVRIDTRIEDPSVAMGMPKNLSASQLKQLFTNPADLTPPNAQQMQQMAQQPAQQSTGTPCVCPPRQVQQMLGLLGSNPRVAITGFYDQATAAAVASFQSACGMQPTGVADSETVNAMYHIVSTLHQRRAA